MTKKENVMPQPEAQNGRPATWDNIIGFQLSGIFHLINFEKVARYHSVLNVDIGINYM
jgi:hypothetical protein